MGKSQQISEIYTPAHLTSSDRLDRLVYIPKWIAAIWLADQTSVLVSSWTRGPNKVASECTVIVFTEYASIRKSQHRTYKTVGNEGKMCTQVVFCCAHTHTHTQTLSFHRVVRWEWCQTNTSFQFQIRGLTLTFQHKTSYRLTLGFFLSSHPLCCFFNTHTLLSFILLTILISNSFSPFLFYIRSWFLTSSSDYFPCLLMSNRKWLLQLIPTCFLLPVAFEQHFLSAVCELSGMPPFIIMEHWHIYQWKMRVHFSLVLNCRQCWLFEKKKETRWEGK